MPVLGVSSVEWNDTQVAARLFNNIYIYIYNKQEYLVFRKLVADRHDLLFLGPMSFNGMASLHTRPWAECRI